MKQSISNFINTNPRCEICFEDIDFNKNNKNKEYNKRCINCGCWYHIICELENFGKNYSNNKCYTCNTLSETKKKCIICQKNTGMMINCNKNKWIHILCLKSFDFFFKVNKPDDENVYTNSLIKAKSRKCNICNERSILMLNCKKCGLNFHPFCAFKNNFIIKNYNSFINYPCCKDHLLYCKNIMNLNNENHIENNNYEKNCKKLLKLNFQNIKNELDIKNKYYSTKYSSILKKFDDMKYKINWESYNIYFKEFNEKQFSKFLNESLIKNDRLNPKYEKWKLGEFIYRKYYCFLLFKIGDFDNVLGNFKRIKDSKMKDIKFINRKRLLKKYYESEENLDQKIYLKRAFGLNKIQKKILSLEGLARSENNNLNLNSKNNFISNEIKIKKTMLKIITLKNSLLISKLNEKIKTHLSKNIKQNIQNYPEQIKKLTSKLNYLKIMKSLSENLNQHFGQLIQNINNNECDCCVCFSELEDSNIPILYCDGCNVGFHLNCYGLYKIPQGEFFCNLCEKNLYNINNINCCLCQGKYGAMKLINENNWIHITCALISNYVEFDNYKLFTGIKYSVNILDLINNFSCFFCQCNKGELFKCEGCENYCHFFCAYFNGALFNFDKDKNNWKFKLRIICCCCNKCSNYNEEKRLFEIKYRKLIYQHIKTNNY